MILDSENNIVECSNSVSVLEPVILFSSRNAQSLMTSHSISGNFVTLAKFSNVLFQLNTTQIQEKNLKVARVTRNLVYFSYFQIVSQVQTDSRQLISAVLLLSYGTRSRHICPRRIILCRQVLSSYNSSLNSLFFLDISLSSRKSDFRG